MEKLNTEEIKVDFINMDSHKLIETYKLDTYGFLVRLSIILSLDDFILIDKSLSNKAQDVLGYLRSQHKEGELNSLISSMINQINVTQIQHNDVGKLDTAIDKYIDDMDNYILGNYNSMEKRRIEEFERSLIFIDQVHENEELYRKNESVLLSFVRNHIYRKHLNKVLKDIKNVKNAKDNEPHKKLIK